MPAGRKAVVDSPFLGAAYFDSLKREQTGNFTDNRSPGVSWGRPEAAGSGRHRNEAARCERAGRGPPRGLEGPVAGTVALTTLGRVRGA